MEDIAYSKIIFTPTLIDNVGDIGKVLGEFLDEQKSIIQSLLEAKFPGMNREAVQKTLNEFITLEGTKRPLRKSQIFSQELNPEQLDYCLDQLEKARILRYKDGLYELAHDTLAKRISDERSASDVAFLEVVKMVKDRHRIFESTKTLLNTNELQLFKSVEARLIKEQAISEEEWKYVRRSRQYSRRRKIMLWSVVSSVILILAAASLYSFQQRGIALQNQQVAVEAQKKAEDNLVKLEEEQARRTEALYNQHLASAQSYKAQSEYLLAIQECDLALAFKEDGEEAIQLRAECEQLSGVKDQFARLISQGDALMARGDDYLVDARNRYLTARRLGYQNVIADSKITTVDGKLPAVFDKYIKNGDTFKRVNDCRRALENFRKALRIRPNDAELKRKILECETG